MRSVWLERGRLLLGSPQNFSGTSRLWNRFSASPLQPMEEKASARVAMATLLSLDLWYASFWMLMFNWQMRAVPKIPDLHRQCGKTKAETTLVHIGEPPPQPLTDHFASPASSIQYVTLGSSSVPLACVKSAMMTRLGSLVEAINCSWWWHERIKSGEKERPPLYHFVQIGIFSGFFPSVGSRNVYDCGLISIMHFLAKPLRERQPFFMSRAFNL